jgi:hypothetical protein
MKNSQPPRKHSELELPDEEEMEEEIEDVVVDAAIEEAEKPAIDIAADGPGRDHGRSSLKP